MKTPPPSDNKPCLIEFTAKKQKRLEQKIYAPLEAKTKKILEKLEKRLQQIDEKITPENLSATKEKIGHWLNRHTAERVELESTKSPKDLSERVSAKMSQKVEELRNKISESLSQPDQPTLKERLSKAEIWTH